MQHLADGWTGIAPVNVFHERPDLEATALERLGAGDPVPYAHFTPGDRLIQVGVIVAPDAAGPPRIRSARLLREAALDEAAIYLAGHHAMSGGQAYMRLSTR